MGQFKVNKTQQRAQHTTTTTQAAKREEKTRLRLLERLSKEEMAAEAKMNTEESIVLSYDLNDPAADPSV